MIMKTAHILILALVVSTGLGTLSNAQVPKKKKDPATSLYLAANGLFNRKLYGLAAGEYEKFLAKYRTHPKAINVEFGLSLSYFELRKYDKAEPLLAKLAANANAPQRDHIHLLLGESRLKLKKIPQAEAAFNAGLKLSKPGNVQAFIQKGLLLAQFKQKKWKEVVATAKAPTDRIARFAAWHLDLGADRVTLYFDAPDPAQIDALRHPRITAHACDAAHWDKRRGRPETHQLRQARNATEAWRHCNAEWLAHIDVDEFLWPADDMANALASLPKTQNVARVRPAESLGDAVLGHVQSPEFEDLGESGDRVALQVLEHLIGRADDMAGRVAISALPSGNPDGLRISR
mgnify:CR=1 FL=1